MKNNYLFLTSTFCRRVLFASLLSGVFQGASAQKYYRSKASGDWATASTWQSSTDNATWTNATASPNYTDYTITIQSAHTVTISSPISLDETIISGAIDVQSLAVLSINDGAGNDIDIQNGGILKVTSADPYINIFIFNGAASLNIATGAKITIGNGGSVGNNNEQFATSLTTVWNNGAVFEWNSSTLFNFSGNTFFPNATAGVVPVFRITSVSGTPGGTSNTIINGLLEVNTNLSLIGNGLKTFRDGIIGTGSLTLNNSTGGYTISGTNAIIGGSLSIILNENLRTTNGVTIPAGANVNISTGSSFRILKGAGSFLVNGVVDMNSVSISNTSGDVTVNGTLKTGNPSGFNATGATIVSGTVVLNAGSLIEYNGLGNQDVNARNDYKNIKFSGSGIKSLISGFNPAGMVTITGSAILDASNFTFGDAGTSLTMNGGRFKMSGTGTKPDISGTYNITGGVIEFYNSLLTTQSIRSPKTYLNIEVSGNNVGNGLGNITIASGGTFTIKTGGTFTINQNQIIGPTGSQTVTVETGATFGCGNMDGFSGGDGSSGNSTSLNSDIENINLNSGSIVNYSRATGGGNQSITTELVYPNLILSGMGIKNIPRNINPFVISPTGSMEIKAGVCFDADRTKWITMNFNNRPVILRSDATGTASIGDLTRVIVQNATDFTIERFIPIGRKWRFVSVPTNTTQTIKEAWQEGALTQNDNLVPGYGTQITDINQSTWRANAFDSFSVSGPSMKYHDANSPTGWTGVANTNINIANRAGYMLFVRGDRTIRGFSPGITSTTLRTRGPLYTGDLPPIPVPASAVASIGNPYPSALDMTLIPKTGTQNIFYLWDPKLSGSYGVGGYQTFTFTAGNYHVTPGGGSYGASGSVENLIRSGAAFFVRGSSGGGNINFQENAKVYDGGAGNVFAMPDKSEILHCNLYAAGPKPTIVDGVTVEYGLLYSNTIDDDDAIKLTNNNENVGILSRRKLLAVERRLPLVLIDTLKFNSDTVTLNLTGVRVQKYQWEISIENMEIPGRTARVVDQYLKKVTPLNLNGTTTFDFEIINIPGSYAPDRFLIVFNSLMNININPYELFWKEGLSKKDLTEKNQFVIYPNPVIDNTIHIEFDRQMEGKYALTLFNNLGQVVYKGEELVARNSRFKNVKLDKSFPSGIYKLEIISASGSKSIKQVIIN